MTTTRSSLNPGRFLLGFLLRRNLPAGLCFFGVSFFCFPLQYILEIFFSRPSPDGILYLYMSTRAHIYTGLSLAVMFAMVPALSLLLALVQAHWLHSRRASDLYHSLPIRRESLLLANAGAVFFTIALPLTLDYLIILGAGALRLAIGLPQNSLGFTLAVGEILLDWAGWMVTSLATIAVVLLVAVKIGSAFENLLFSLEVFCAPAGIVFISALVCDRYLTGFVSGLNGWELTWSTPLLLMLGRVMEHTMYIDPPPFYAMDWAILLWLVLALALLGAACRLYRRRPSELAETAGAREPLNTLGKAVLVYIGGLGLALLIHEESHLDTGAQPFWVTALVGAALTALACQVLMDRGFRGLKRSLPALAATVAVVTAAAFVMTHGGLGYVNYIPAAGKVRNAAITYRGRYGQLAEWALADTEETDGEGRYRYGDTGWALFTTPEGVRLVQDLHRHLLQIDPEGDEVYASGLFIRYNDRVERGYASLGPNVLDPRLYRDVTALLAIEESREFREQTDPRFTITPEEIKAVRVSDVTGLKTSNPITSQETIRRLVEAMKADAEAFDPTLFRDGSAKAAAYLTVETQLPRERLSDARIDRDCWRSFCIPVYRQDERTMEFFWTSGLGEMTGRLHKDKVTALTIRWAGVSYMAREVYWSGTGPQDLWPSRETSAVLTNRPIQSRMSEDGAYILRDPEKIRQLLDKCLGVDCHIREKGYIVTLEGEDRTGCSFWLSDEDTPDEVKAYFGETVSFPVFQYE